MELTVAVIGAPHGLKGEVRLDVRTDEPHRRLAAGNALETDPADSGPLTIVRSRASTNGWYVTFAEAADRTQAEALRGVCLVIESDEEDDDPDGWYAHQLVGLAARHVDGRELGAVTGVEVLPAHDLLTVRELSGETVRVPFVEAFVRDVDVSAGVVTLDPPGGLFAGDTDPDDDTEVEPDADSDVDSEVEPDTDVGVEPERG